MPKSISVIEAEIIDEFSLFDDWMDKYQYIIEMGQSLPGLPEPAKTEDHLVKGCVSRVWLTADAQEGKLHFEADSDAVITKGLIALLIRVLSDQSPAEIAKAELKFIDEIGLRQHLSPNRANGLVSMMKKMKMYAIAHQAA